jgi:hypothetical protein
MAQLGHRIARSLWPCDAFSLRPQSGLAIGSAPSPNLKALRLAITKISQRKSPATNG